MKVYLDTIGCRLNQSEIETYARQFRKAGHTLVSTPAEADMVVVNTCSVTAAAASDSRQKIRQAVRLGAGSVVATGCWATLNPEAAAALPAVQKVVPNAAKDTLVSDLLQIPIEIFDQEPVEREPVPGARARTRAFIKVQDGCDNHCTFCITTVARGTGRSRPVEQILKDVRAALHELDFTSKSESDVDLNTTAKEIVLTGVHLGSWGQDFEQPRHLQHLVQTILTETDTPRLRLSSLEPWDLTAEFFALWENPRLCRHLHLPLQSGCAATLRRMARKTTPEAFASLVEASRRVIPDVAITTDLIAGFPGETEAEHSETLNFVQKMEFAGGHVFTYSARPGTGAARLPGQVPHPVRKERNSRLRQVLEESGRRYRQQFVGQEMLVLWESATRLGPETWQMHGLTDNYLRVSAEAPRHMWNTITPVRLMALSGEDIVGQVG